MSDKFDFIQYDIFQSFTNLIAFTTRKKTFKDQTPRFTGDNSDTFSHHRNYLAEKLGISPHKLIFPRQTHTNYVAEISEIPKYELNNTDALVTDRSGICLCIQTADCAPILLYDFKQKAIAAVHAGWRGTVSKIAEKAVLKMKNKFGTSAENLYALIGPSISPEMYEVGEEVIRAARKNIPHAEMAILEIGEKKPHFDIWEANRRILMNCGVLFENIEIFGECSFQNSKDYFSARRDGVKTGRNVSGIMLL